MSRLTAAYVAGLIDGEGCIYINPHRGKGLTYATVVTIGMTAKALEILKVLHKQYGGWTGQTRAATDRWDAAHAWSVTGPTAAEMLREIQEHLILKAEQARLAIRLEDIKASLPRRPNGSTAWTDHARWHCKTIHLRIHELNAKGPAVPAAPARIAGQLPIARRVAGQWVTDQGDLFSDTGWASFKGPWPTSALMVNGVVYPLPAPGHRTAASGCSSSPGLLPTPTAREKGGRNSRHGDTSRGDDLPEVVKYLPTPNATDWKGAGQPPGRVRDGRPRPASDADLPTAVHLLKTPTAQLAMNGGSQHPDKRREGGHGPTLADQVEHQLLPTPRATDGAKGGPNQRGSSGDLMLPSAVMDLLPTPMAADGGRMSRTMPRGNPTLIGALLPTPSATDSHGHYNRSGDRAGELLLPGIAEALTSRGAPTSPRSADGRRSSAAPHPGQLSLDGLESA